MASSNKKILIAASIYPPDAGGPAVHAKAQLEGFRTLGFETDLVTLTSFRKWPRWLRHLLFLVALYKKAVNSSLIYAHDAWGVGFPALLVARITGSKLILRIGGDMAWEKLVESKQGSKSFNEWYSSGLYKSSLFYMLTRIVLPRVNMVIVPTKLLADAYIKYYGVNPDNIRIIHNPVSGGIGIITKQEKTIIYASRLVSYKNLPLVLKVLSKIFPSHPDLQFIVMGDGPDKSHLESIARSLGIEKNVIFTGVISQREVFEKTAACLFAIGPALTEFNPNCILQSIGFGKPFLISREHGLPFDVPKEFMFDPRDESELERAILNFLDEEGYARALSLVRSIEFKMSWEDNLEANAGVINSVLSGSK